MYNQGLMRWIVFAALAIIVAGGAGAVLAGSPQLINYQGRLTDAGGEPLNGEYAITFTIYDDPVLSTPVNVIWTEIHLDVTVTDGIFNVLLGSVTLLNINQFADTVRYLGVKVDEDPEISPRARIAAIPYAFQSVMSDSAGHSSTIANDAVTSSSIEDGSINFIDIGPNGAAAGMIMKFDGAFWIPGPDEVGGTTWNWSDSSSHGPDSVLFADTGSYAYHVQTVSGATGGSITGNLGLYDNGDLRASLIGQGYGELTLRDFPDGDLTVDLSAGMANGGKLILYQEDGATSGTLLMAGSTSSGASLTLNNALGDATITLDAQDDLEAYDDGARLTLYDGTSPAIIMNAIDVNTYGAQMIMRVANDTTVSIYANGDAADGGGIIRLYDGDKHKTVHIDANGATYGGAQLSLSDHDATTTISMDAESGSAGGALVTFHDSVGTTTIYMDANGASGGAQVSLIDHDSTTTISLDAESGVNGGANISLSTGEGQNTVEIQASESGTDGSQVFLRGADGTVTVDIDAEEGTDGGGIVKIYEADGTKTVHIDAQGVTYGGAQVSLSDHDGTTTISMDAESGSSDGGANVRLLTGAGVETIRLDADYGGTGEGRVITTVLEITGGADVSEQFDIRNDQASVEPLPGMVVCIDSEHPGGLVISSKAYDKTVAGIISGAGGIKPGMLMGQFGSVSDGRFAVALTGRVYCRADAFYGPISPGDLLTTSDTPGHAMRVTDFGKAQGVIIGKAMSSLESGRGLVLVLVTLQ